MTVTAAELTFIQNHTRPVVRSLKPRLGDEKQAYTVSGPVCTVAPAVTGTATVGSTLTSTTGTWLNTPTFTQQWRRNGISLAGATALTYVLVAADSKAAIDCVITATKGVSVVPQASNPVSIA